MDAGSYESAIREAEARAGRSYFDHYVIADDEIGFLVMNAGDYGQIPPDRIERIVYCAKAGQLDEY